jgi:hypothetical protein
VTRWRATVLGLALVLAGPTACAQEEADPGGTTTVTVTPSSSASPAPEPEPTATLDQPAAQAFVEAFRFPPEEEWEQDGDFPSTPDTSATGVAAFGCTEADVPGALAVRTVLKPGAETGNLRQLAVFADPATAAEAFATLRDTMRGCHAEPQRFDDGAQVTETTFVGEQLALGEESFWVGAKEVPVAADGTRGEELFYSQAALYALDGATVSVLVDPAFGDDQRAGFVDDASAEWEQLRPQLDGLGD